MLGIIKKDSLFFLVAMFIIYPSIFILWKIFGKAFDLQFAILAGFLLHILLYGPMIINEQDEDKSNGYSFLTTLPVKIYEIVFVKFAFVFAFVLLFVSLNSLVFSLTLQSAYMFNIARNVLVTSGVLCLVVAALFYIGVFLFGFSNFFRFGVLFFSVLLLSGGVIAQFLLIKKVNIVSLIIAGLSNFIQNVNIVVFAFSGIMIYFGLMLTAIKVKSFTGVK